MREQVCLWLCPYARIHGVMYDKNIQLPTYDEQRSEPRASVNKNRSLQSGGRVECDQCLAVCPTGIDICEGQQVGCITCGLCIDGCDMVMNKLNQPKGPIRYASLNQLHKKTDNKIMHRPQVIVSIGFILFSILATIYGVNSMTDAELSVIDSRQPMYVMMSDNSVQNSCQVRIFNKTEKD